MIHDDLDIMNSDKDQIANKELVRGLKEGDTASFKGVFLLFEQKLYRFAFSITKSEYISEEIVQEVFVKVWEKRKTLDISRSFDSYIFTMTRNLTYNYLRDASRRQSIRNELWTNINSLQQQADAELIFEEYEKIVEDIVQSLPQQKRSIYRLSRQQGKSNSEIADILGISPKTVKNHLWKTMRMIRVQLKPYLDDTLKILVLICFII
ncbi:RNA polymerase sigma-70 factor [Membranicola marinus]|uniref:RNA polymerase sigma-70 factor n=1 Tax=Membranihabitans marinus TaxID=1227546 RepID=A0A953HVW7_9BACT|nr:RNA polymerase sigma-70 factor [Membranihabitans marinus]MBY5959215.1 RNA polymerase sigma-70 factor [Membranihabitans marinus]